MEIFTFKTPQEMGIAVAKHGGDALKQVIAEKGAANIILATGSSQFETIEQLCHPIRI